MTPEGRVKVQVKKWLKEHGAYFFMPVQTGYGAATLDFLVCLNGCFVAIETKAPGKKATTRQRLVIDEIYRAGGYAFVATSVDDLDVFLSVLVNVARSRA
jgi:hypothetical protein